MTLSTLLSLLVSWFSHSEMGVLVIKMTVCIAQRETQIEPVLFIRSIQFMISGS